MTLEAAAESAFCRQVRAEYLAADRAASRGGGGGRADVAGLQRQIAAAQAEARRNGCRRVLFGRPGKNCPSILANLAKLQRDYERARAGGGGLFAANNNARFERDRLRSVLMRNGCEIPSREVDTAFGGGGYRTLCVRTCDGYYFPISFSTNRSRFKIDEAVCKSMYGGAPAELFVHYNGSPSETAVSLQGKRLAAEPYAFAFRQDFNPVCQAELMRGLANLGRAFAARIAEAQSNDAVKPRGPAPVLLPNPSPRIAGGHDPETLANLAGRFTVAPVLTPEEEAIAAASAPIRKLGPEYYYVTPIAIEALRKPLPRGPEFSLIGAAHANERDDDDGTTVQ
jgi:hypothetical protein